MFNDNVTVSYNADISGYASSMSQAMAITSQYAKVTDSLSGKIANVGATFTTAVLGVGKFLGANKTGVSQAAAYESAMSSLAATAKASGQNFGQMSDGVKQLARDFPIGISGATQMVSALQQLGTKQKDIKGLSETFVKLGAATGTNASEIGTQMKLLSNAFNDDSPERIKKFGDSVTTLQASFGAGASSTLQFSKAIAPLAKTAGLGETAVLGISGAFSKMGEDGFAGANALNKVLTDINKAVTDGSPVLGEYASALGVTSDQFKNMFKSDSAGTITKLFDNLGKDGAQGQRTLEALGLDGVRTQRALTSAAQQGGVGRGIETARRAYGSGSTERASEEAMSGLNDSLTKLSETSSQIASNIGKPFLSLATLVVSAGNKVANVFQALTQNKLVQYFAALGGVIGLVTKAFAVMATARFVTGLKPVARFMGSANLQRAGLLDGLSEQALNGLSGADREAYVKRERERISRRIQSEARWTDRRKQRAELALANMADEVLGGRQYASAGAGRGAGELRRDITGARSRSIIGRAGRGLAGGIAAAADYGMNFFKTSWFNSAMVDVSKDGGVNDLSSDRRKAAGAAGRKAAKEGFDRAKEAFDNKNVWGGVKEAALGTIAGMRANNAVLKEGLKPTARLWVVTKEVTGSLASLSKSMVGEGSIRAFGRNLTTRDGWDGVGRGLMRRGANAPAYAFNTARTGFNLARAGSFGSAAAALTNPWGLAVGAVAAGGYGYYMTQKSKTEVKDLAAANVKDLYKNTNDFANATGLAGKGVVEFTDRSKDAADTMSLMARNMKQAMTIDSQAAAAATAPGYQATMRFKIKGSDENAAEMVASKVSAIGGGDVALTRRAALDAYNQAVANKWSGAQIDQLKKALEDKGAKGNSGAKPDFDSLAGLSQEANKYRDAQVLGFRAIGMSEDVTGSVNQWGQTFGQNVQRISDYYGTNAATAAVSQQAVSGAVGNSFDGKTGKVRDALAEQINSVTDTLDDGKLRGLGTALNKISVITDEVRRDKTVDDYSAGQIFTGQMAIELATGGGKGKSDANVTSVTKEYTDILKKKGLSEEKLAKMVEEGKGGQEITGVRVDGRGTDQALSAQEALAISRAQRINDEVKQAGGYANLQDTSEVDKSLMRGIYDVEKSRGTNTGEFNEASPTDTKVGNDFAKNWLKVTKEVKDAGEVIDGVGQNGKPLSEEAKKIKAFIDNPNDYKAKRDMIPVGEKLFSTSENGKQLSERQTMRNARDVMLGVPGSTAIPVQVAAAVYQQGLERRSVTDSSKTSMQLIDRAKSEYRDAKKSVQAGTSEQTQEEVERLRGAALSARQQQAQIQKQVMLDQIEYDKQKTRAAEDFGISQARALEDYNTQRARSEEQFQIQVQRSEEQYLRQRGDATKDYQRSVRISTREFNISQRLAQEQFQIQMLRANRDFGIQLGRMAEDAAASMLSPYERMQQEAVMSAQGILLNMNEQQARMKEQLAAIDQLKASGLDGKAIDLLGLADPKKAQQTMEIAANVMTDPSLIQKLNQKVSERIKLGGGYVAESKEGKRGKEDFARQMQDMRDDFERNTKIQRDAFRRSMDDQEKSFRIQMRRMRRDYLIMMRQSREDYSRQMSYMADDFTKTTTRAMEDFGRSMDRMAKDLEDKYLTVTGKWKDISKKAHDALKKNNGDFSQNFLGGLTEVFTGAEGNMKRFIKGWNEYVKTNKLKGFSVEPPRPGGGGSGGMSQRNPGAKSVEPTAMSVASAGWHSANTLDAGTPESTVRAYQAASADIGVGLGTPVYAVNDGKIEFSGASDSYNPGFIKLRTAHNKFIYGHLSRFDVRTGDNVVAGQQIGLSGESTKGGGPHLHFEIRDMNDGWSKTISSWASRNLAHGGIATRPTKALLGEAGYSEAVIPLNSRGASVLAEAMRRYASADEIRATRTRPYSQPVVNHVSVSNDYSNRFTGPITVQSSDPDDMARRLEARKRRQALIEPSYARSRR